MKVVRIPKRAKGQFRTIYVPDEAEKATYRLLLPALTQVALKLCDKHVVHGFMPCRSPVTNAYAHRGYRFTLSMDLADFFDTVGAAHLYGKMGDELIASVLVDGAPRQGLPTSPIVANIAATDLDAAIVAHLAAINERPAYLPPFPYPNDPPIVYTRYADDLAFSFHCHETYVWLKLTLPALVESCGFVVNHRKTRLQDSRYGRRVITGVAIDGSDLIVPRAIRRKIRAAKDWGTKRSRSLAGLEEWAKLRLPYKPIEHTLAVLKGVWDIHRGKMAITNYAAKDMWFAELAAVSGLKDRDQIAHYIRNALRGRFTKADIKRVDRIVERIKPTGLPPG